MTLEPLFDRVLIKRESLQEMSKTIHIPDPVDKRERPARGTIVACGPTVGYLDDETREVVQDLQPGMKVIFGRNAGTEIEVESEKFWIVADRDILCKIKE